MVHRGDPILTVHAVAIATKWVHHRAMATKAVVVFVRKVLPTMMARVAIVKKAADVGDQKARPAAMARPEMLKKVPDVCDETDHPAAMVRPETATKGVAIVDQTARRVAMDHLQKMALVASTIPTETGHPIRPAPARIRKKATTSPKLLFNSL